MIKIITTLLLMFALTWVSQSYNLEFDDGPTRYTVPIIRTLNRRATFYMRWDNVIKNQGIAKMVADQWHEICNHTFDHPDITTLTTGQLISQIVLTNSLIYKATGVLPDCFRPPYGKYNNTTIYVLDLLWMDMRRSMDEWIIDSLDRKYKRVDEIVNHTRKQEWHTILFRDTSWKSRQAMSHFSH